MGRIYCITGKAEQEYGKILKSLMDWSSSEQLIEFVSEPEDGIYNTYIYNYLIAAEENKFREICLQQGEDNIIPIYLKNEDEDDSALMQEGVFKAYNPKDFKNCMKEIVETEFANYRTNQYEFKDPEDIKEGNVGFEGENSENIEGAEGKPPKAIKKFFIAVKSFAKAHKKLSIIASSAFVLLLTGIIVLVSVFGGYRNAIEANYGFDMFYGDGTVCVVSKAGDFYTFDGYDNCTLKNSLDKNSAITLTEYSELYFIGKNDFFKVGDNIIYAEISNYGDYIYYITEENSLYKYKVSSKKQEEVGAFDIPFIESINIVISPDGKKCVIECGANKYFCEEDKRVPLYDIAQVIGLSDKKTVYAMNISYELVIMNDNGGEYEVTDTLSSVREIYINKDYSEIMFWVEDTSYLEEYGASSISNSLGVIRDSKTVIYLSNGEFVENEGFYGIYREGSFVQDVNDALYFGNKIKQGASNTYWVDVASFRDLLYVSDSRICKMGRDYKFKTTLDLSDLADGGVRMIGLYSGKIYYTKEENRVNNLYSISLSGKKSRLTSYEMGFSFMAVAENGAIYFMDTYGMDIYYKRGNKTTRLAYFGEFGYNGYFFVDSKNDIAYFENGNKLYYSESGNTPVFMYDNDGDDPITFEQRETGLYFTMRKVLNRSEYEEITYIETFRIDDNKEIQKVVEKEISKSIDMYDWMPYPEPAIGYN